MLPWLRLSFAGLCLLLSLVFAALWVRSYWVMDQWTHERLEPKTDEVLTFGSARGRLLIQYSRSSSPSLARPTTRRTAYTRSDPDALDVQWAWFDRRVERASWTTGVEIIRHSTLFPHALPLFAFLLPPAWVAWSTRRRTRALLREGVCPECGYDCRATPDRCPECGTELTRPAAA